MTAFGATQLFGTGLANVGNPSPKPTPAQGTRRQNHPLDRHRAALVGAADPGGLLAMAGDDADTLIELGDDVFRRAGFEERNAVLAAGGENALARLPHLGRVRVARHHTISERQTEIAGAELGKAEPGDGEDLFAIGDALRALELDAEQQLALRVERPRVAALEIFLGRDAPYRRGGSLRAATARADAEPASCRLAGCAPHTLDGRRQGRVRTRGLV